MSFRTSSANEFRAKKTLENNIRRNPGFRTTRIGPLPFFLPPFLPSSFPSLFFLFFFFSFSSLILFPHHFFARPLLIFFSPFFLSLSLFFFFFFFLLLGLGRLLRHDIYTVYVRISGVYGVGAMARRPRSGPPWHPTPWVPTTHNSCPSVSTPPETLGAVFFRVGLSFGILFSSAYGE
jgi:hypothetical protein